jgi:hypothetical protein
MRVVWCGGRAATRQHLSPAAAVRWQQLHPGLIALHRFHGVVADAAVGVEAGFCLPRQQQALSTMCAAAQIDRVNHFARRHKAAGVPAVFFRGQLLELMRWTPRHSQNLPGDGITYEIPENRELFVNAALIAGDLWGQRIYGSKLSTAASVDEARLKALGALRKGVEEGNLAPHIGIAIGRGLKLFTDYLPRQLPELGDQFRAATGLSVE